jgi:hypothetical protein
MHFNGIKCSVVPILLDKENSKHVSCMETSVLLFVSVTDKLLQSQQFYKTTDKISPAVSCKFNITPTAYKLTRLNFL